MKKKLHDAIPRIIKNNYFIEGEGKIEIEYVRKDMHDAILEDNLQLEKKLFRLQMLVVKWAEAGNILHFSLLNQKIEKLLNSK
jgi:hypothetical protein